MKWMEVSQRARGARRCGIYSLENQKREKKEGAILLNLPLESHPFRKLGTPRGVMTRHHCSATMGQKQGQLQNAFPKGARRQCPEHIPDTGHTDRGVMPEGRAPPVGRQI